MIRAEASRSLHPWVPPVYLYRANRESAGKGYSQDASSGGPRRILIKRTISGMGTLYVKGQRLRVPPDWAFVIERPGPYVYCVEDHSEPWCFEYVTIAFGQGGELLPPWLKREPLCCFKDYVGLSRQFSALLEMCLSDPSGEDLLQSALAYRFFLAYVSARVQGSVSNENLPVARCKRYLEQHFTEPFLIRHVAGQVGYTPEALTRLFHKRYGMTPRRYVNWLRIRRACLLLESGTLTLKALAAECGFSSPQYFGRAFRQILKLSPGQYRHTPDPLRPELVSGEA